MKPNTQKPTTIKMIKFASCFDCPYMGQCAHEAYHHFRSGYCAKLRKSIQLDNDEYIHKQCPLPNEDDLEKGSYVWGNRSMG